MMNSTEREEAKAAQSGSRRDFLKLGGLAGAGWLLSRSPLMAGPFAADEWDNYIPLDKKLRPEWIRSLYERGTPTAYSKSRDELRYIGMPVGGLCCGTLYLGGDGRLWNWDIFNQKTEGVLPRRVSWSDVGMDFQSGDDAIRPRDGATYVKPALQTDSQDIAQGFALRVSTPSGTQHTRRLDASSWAEVRFTGQYPIGTVDYTDPACPVQVRMEAFSPFVPHSLEDSSLPATVFRFRLENTGNAKAVVQLAGWQQNAVLFHSAPTTAGERVNRRIAIPGATSIAMKYRPMLRAGDSERPDLLVEDFEGDYSRWQVEGEAFGTRPARRASVPDYQGDLRNEGDGVANSHATAPGRDIGEKDNATGLMRSGPVLIQRKFLSFLIGGGQREDVGLRVLVGDEVVHDVHGHNNNAMRRVNLDVSNHEGQTAVVEIYDRAQGGWGNVGVDQIVQTDVAKDEALLVDRLDYGTMALCTLGNADIGWDTDIPAGALPDAAFPLKRSRDSSDQSAAPVGSLVRTLELNAGESHDVVFVLAWHFPNTSLPTPDARTGNHYARRFGHAMDVVAYVLRELPRLEQLTRLWRDTWADSTLPHWFLERTFVNTSILATTTCHRFGSGRFWAWEGIGCCQGTCTHVWHYAQAVGRIFPEIERDQRERVDFGVGFDTEHGVVRHRAEGTGPAVDGQCGRILGVWREHQMSGDGAFLRRVWPRVKRATEYLLLHDADGDGILDGAQENTLDAAWYGQIAWITSLSIAALEAASQMAVEVGDEAFALRCRDRAAVARGSVESKLFNGEYFIQVPDESREKSLGTYEACHIDQVHGQSWAWQVGLGRVLDRDKTLSALRALWKYNFTPDVGPFRRKFTAGRPYALAGDGGLVMTSNPRLVPNVYGIPSWQIGYFNECMSGFEHQVASHMIAEGMVEEGLAITRAIHDRYHASRRNPFNEIECSDHYARAMASYGSFISICGFECHGPTGTIGFAPRMAPENFRAAFTAAGGWGTYGQLRAGSNQSHRLTVSHGRVRLRTLVVELPEGRRVISASVRLPKEGIPVTLTQTGLRATLQLAEDLWLDSETRFEVDLQLG
jgi:non-lysosomal glucosylceramidase